MGLMKVLVSDMGGVLYSYDPGFDPNKHEKVFEKAMFKLGKADADIKSQLEGELEAVRSGRLKIYSNKFAVENLRASLEDYELVVVSTALVATSRLILERLGLGNVAKKIFDMSDYGSKKERAVWTQIFKQLARIDVIVEDGAANLQAAEEAAKALGFSPKVFKKMPRLSGTN